MRVVGAPSEHACALGDLGYIASRLGGVGALWSVTRRYCFSGVRLRAI